MSQNCGGTSSDGQPCPCRRCVPVTNLDENAPVICRDCRHIESAHPAVLLPQLEAPTGVAAVMARYKGLAKVAGPRATSSTALKATQADAQAETNSGLKRKMGDVDTGGPGKNKKLKGKGKGKASPARLQSIESTLMLLQKKEETQHDEGEKVQVGTIVMLPHGLVGSTL